MRTHSGNLLSTCCLLLPIGATLFFGIFGIPRFAHLSASPSANERQFRVDWDAGVQCSVETADGKPLRPIDLHPRTARETAGESRYFQRPGRAPEGQSVVRIDPGAARTPPRHLEAPAASRNLRDRRDVLERSAGSSARETAPSAVASGTGVVQPANRTSAPVRSVAAESPVTEAETWQVAVQRLKELGISRYRLDVGSAPGLYLFSCFFSPPDRPNYLRRFESESERPLDAVRDVLVQVEEWHSLVVVAESQRQAPVLASNRIVQNVQSNR